MSNKKCCVPGCINSSGESKDILHKLPNPAKEKERFNLWVYAVGGDILSLPNDHTYKYRRVCHRHFEEKYWCSGKHLSVIAIPTRHLAVLEEQSSQHGPAIFEDVKKIIYDPFQTRNVLAQQKDKGILPAEAKETADILIFFDRLFDSVNGSFAKKNRHAKPLLGPVTPTSPHHKAWLESKKLLKDMAFVNPVSKKREYVPTLRNWVWNLEGMEVLLKNLKTTYGITSVWLD